MKIRQVWNFRKPRGNVLLKEPLALKGGRVALDEKPGLGIELDEREIAKLVME